MSYTPGPWHVEDAQVFNDSGNCVGNCSWTPHTTAVRDANAKLIAAAPDMLLALQILVSSGANPSAEQIDTARAAIAKATP